MGVLRVSRCKEQGILFRGHGIGVWRGEEAVEEAASRGKVCHSNIKHGMNERILLGISISDSELCLNVLGDLGVVGDDGDLDTLSSPLERRYLRAKRCSSTPRCISKSDFEIWCFHQTFSGLQNYLRQ